MTTFCAIGNVTIDDLVFSTGETKMNTPGGNGVYSALGLRVWGGNTKLISICGRDYPLEQLQSLGIATDGLRFTDKATLRNWGLYEEDGTRTFVFRGKGVIWEDYSPLPEDLSKATCDHSHLAPLPLHHQLKLCSYLRRNTSGTISLDPDDRMIATVGEGQLLKLVNLVDAFLPSRQEVAALYPDLEATSALKRLRQMAPEVPVIAIKLGAEGVIAHARSQCTYVHVPALKKEVEDPTGAGDAFAGGFLYGFAQAQNLVEGLLTGSVAASFAVEDIGIAGLVRASLEEARKRYTLLDSQVTTHSFV